ncbi:MAG: sulfatase-like hydrolase/transferase [Planctomycetales bacterium]
MTPEQLQEWNAYYEPRNAEYKQHRLTGKDLVRWRYNRYMHDYLGTVLAVDDAVGKLLDCLKAEGLAENTLVVYAARTRGSIWGNMVGSTNAGSSKSRSAPPCSPAGRGSSSRTVSTAT